MPLFPHVMDLLAPLDSSSRSLPSTEGLDDFSDGDVFGPELDTLLDSLVSQTITLLLPKPIHLGHHCPTGVGESPGLHVTAGERRPREGLTRIETKLQNVHPERR
jgi:hypothetical protein